MISDWVSFVAYPNLFGIKGFVIVIVYLGHIRRKTVRCSNYCNNLANLYILITNYYSSYQDVKIS
jgi:hypothetical protein